MYRILALMLCVLITGCSEPTNSTPKIIAPENSPTAVTSPQDTTPKISKPFEYSGYSSPEYTSHTVLTDTVPMSDGEYLAIDVFIPTEGPKDKDFPVVLMYLPYQRANVDPETGAVVNWRDRYATYFTQYGYAFALADMRGTGASSGWIHDFMPQLADDGKELIDWIADQEWCDGNVGMQGGSYLGWSQLASASRKPEALKCILPYAVPLEGFTGEVYPGGIYVQGFMNRWSGFMNPAQRNYYVKGMLLPTKPAVDEDGDGEWLDEIPIDQDGDGTFLNDGYPPKYRDDSKREHIYYNATMAHHIGNYDYSKWAEVTPFIDGESPLGYDLYDLGPNAFAEAIMEHNIPRYHIVGWFDGFARGGLEMYSTMKSPGTSKVLVAPSYHDFDKSPFWSEFGYKIDRVREMLNIEHLRYYDRYLKGIENGVDKEPPVLIYVMHGEGWRLENEWPLARQTNRTLYFDNDHTLSETPTDTGKDSYLSDFTHDSRFGSNTGNRWESIAGNAPKALPIRTELDKQSLLYTSDALKEDVEVTGHPEVNLSVTSSEKYGDFYVYLEDVAPDGTSILVTEGLLRAGFAGLHDNDQIIFGKKGTIDVLPDLPWHGYEKEDYVDGILSEDSPVNLKISLQPTSWVFKQGHRYRVAITTADYPTFRLHPKLSPSNDPAAADTILPTIGVHRGQGGSSISLPIIP